MCESTGRPEPRTHAAPGSGTSALRGAQQTSKYRTSLLNVASPIVGTFSNWIDLCAVQLAPPPPPNSLRRFSSPCWTNLCYSHLLCFWPIHVTHSVTSLISWIPEHHLISIRYSPNTLCDVTCRLGGGLCKKKKHACRSFYGHSGFRPGSSMASPVYTNVLTEGKTGGGSFQLWHTFFPPKGLLLSGQLLRRLFPPTTSRVRGFSQVLLLGRKLDLQPGLGRASQDFHVSRSSLHSPWCIFLSEPFYLLYVDDGWAYLHHTLTKDPLFFLHLPIEKVHEILANPKSCHKAPAMAANFND